jgi:uncharacterized membrane protein YeaQ/YmgE (transglycosylase-associated protein family)
MGEIVHLVMFLVIGLAAGWIASQLVPGEQKDWLGHLIVGVIGSILGGFVLNVLGFSAFGLIARLVTAVGGAVLLIMGMRAIGKRPF